MLVLDQFLDPATTKPVTCNCCLVSLLPMQISYTYLTKRQSSVQFSTCTINVHAKMPICTHIVSTLVYYNTHVSHCTLTDLFST
jgi:hypothetical protein